jgi:hypothetical protein
MIPAHACVAASREAVRKREEKKMRKRMSLMMKLAAKGGKSKTKYTEGCF